MEGSRDASTSAQRQTVTKNRGSFLQPPNAIFEEEYSPRIYEEAIVTGPSGMQPAPSASGDPGSDALGQQGSLTASPLPHYGEPENDIRTRKNSFFSKKSPLNKIISSFSSNESGSHSAKAFAGLHKSSNGIRAGSRATTTSLSTSVRELEKRANALMPNVGVLSGISIKPDGPVRGAQLLDYSDGLVEIQDESNTGTDWTRTKSKQEMKFLNEGWREGDITVHVPYVASNINLEQRRLATDQIHKSTIHLQSAQTYKRAIVSITLPKARAALRDDFKKRLATALEKRDKKAVKAIFNDYGRVIALQNVLGAERQLVTEATNVTKSTERRIRTHFQAMLTSSQLPVTAKFRFGRSKAQQDAYETAVQQKKTYFVGGSTKYQNEKHLDDWKESVESPENWKVVRRTNIVPITALLSESDQQTILDMFAPLQGVWIHSRMKQVACSHFHVFQPVISENKAKDGWFYLGQSCDGSQALLVKEVNSNGGALIPVEFSAQDLSMEAGPLKTVWRRYLPTHVDRFCALETTSELHYSLGHYFYGRNTLKNFLQGHGDSGRLCAVRTDLLARAEYTEALKRGLFKGSLWKIGSADVDGSIPTHNLQLFRASKTRRKPSGVVLSLRKDRVQMLSSEEVDRMYPRDGNQAQSPGEVAA